MGRSLGGGGVERKTGSEIEAKGTAGLAGSAITASRVELKREGFDDADNASIEGTVTDFTGTEDFRGASPAG